MSYAMTRRVPLTVDEADAAVRDARAAEGFGGLTEIDVQATLKQKIDVDIADYRILGACNPPFAHGAIEAEPDLGLLLPCNVVVRSEGDETVLSVIDPVAQLGVSGNPALEEFAGEVKERLERVLAAV